MLSKLAFKNIKKSIKDYSIYFFTLVIAISIFYIFNSMDAQTSILELSTSKKELIKSLIKVLSYISIFISIVLGFLIIYSNNFLIKRRKKEIGLYLTLGMSKWKVSKILVIETLLVGLVSLGVGLLVGVFLSQFLSIITANLFEVSMESYKFVFSSSALIKTILYFGIIFILVMLFNVITLSRYKLINLLNAKKKNESIKIRNKYVTIISFVLSLTLIGYAYKLLFEDVLFEMSSKITIMLISGALGTLLFFFSLSGFLLWLFKKIKKVYYKGLNIFVLKQVNSKINSNVFSTTIICLLLLLTIGILSSSISLSGAINDGFNNNNMTDFTLVGMYHRYENEEFVPQYIDFQKIINNDNFSNYVKDYFLYNLYEDENVNIINLMNKKTREEVIKTYGSGIEESTVPIMKESDYKALLELYNMEDKYIDIKENEYLVLCNMDTIMEYFAPALKEGNTLKINNQTLIPSVKEIQEIAIKNAQGNEGLIVISDSLAENLNVYDSTYLIGNYVNHNIDNYDDTFRRFLTDDCELDYIYIDSKEQNKDSGINTKILMTFIGLYLGIVFAISSVTILAIKELSESSDNKERYRVLRQIGSDEKMINKALLIQMGISFMLPLALALIHAYFGLKEINKVINLLGNINLTENIILTTLFMVIIYGGYFLATYLCSKRVIKE